MSEQPKPLNTLALEVVEINRANGWEVVTWDEYQDAMHGNTIAARKIGTILALIHSEVSEALEALRKGDPGNFAEEVADVVIRCLDLAGGAGIDLDAAITAKLAHNRRRSLRHGGKTV